LNLEKLIIPITTDTKDTEKPLGKIGELFQKITGISAGTIAAVAGIGTAVYEAGKFIAQCNEEAMKYAKNMEDMARVTGMTTDDVQKLSMASEQAGISQEAFTKAMEQATREVIALRFPALKIWQRNMTLFKLLWKEQNILLMYLVKPDKIWVTCFKVVQQS